MRLPASAPPAHERLTLTDADFAALMAPLGPWATDRRVAVAVSGGADSLCLAWLAARWGQPLGLIVDHGLRPESTAEAALTASRLARFGMRSRILTLDGLRPGPSLASRARDARYKALAQACTAENLADLLLGHHRRDQAETLLIRRAARSGDSGLACMPVIATANAMRLVRPFLGIPPGRLRAILRAHNIAWAEDPSNTDLAVTRARLRFELDDPEGDAPATRDLAGQAARHAGGRAAADAQIAATLAERAAIFPQAYALLTPGPIDHTALACLIRALTGAPYPPPARAVQRLAGSPRPCTLAGVRFSPAGRLGPGLMLTREVAAMQGEINAENGALWDRRFTLSAPPDLPETALLGPLGRDAAAFRDASALPDAVLQTLPALRLRSHVIAVPHLGPTTASLPYPLSISFTPKIPAAGAPFDRGKPGGAER